MRIKGNHRFAIINHLFANVFFQYYFLQASLVAYLFLLQGHAAYAQGQTKPISPEAQKTEAAEQQAPTGELNGNGLSAPGISSDSYGGMVINQTITVAGQDFFQYFIGAWLDTRSLRKRIPKRPGSLRFQLLSERLCGIIRRCASFLLPAFPAPANR